jgi:hypothetical protein
VFVKELKFEKIERWRVFKTYNTCELETFIDFFTILDWTVERNWIFRPQRKQTAVFRIFRHGQCCHFLCFWMKYAKCLLHYKHVFLIQRNTLPIYIISFLRSKQFCKILKKFAKLHWSNSTRVYCTVYTWHGLIFQPLMCLYFSRRIFTSWLTFEICITLRIWENCFQISHRKKNT